MWLIMRVEFGSDSNLADVTHLKLLSLICVDDFCFADKNLTEKKDGNKKEKFPILRKNDCVYKISTYDLFPLFFCPGINIVLIPRIREEET